MSIDWIPAIIILLPSMLGTIGLLLTIKLYWSIRKKGTELER